MEEQRPTAPEGPPRGRTLDSVMPILLFVGLNRLAGLGWAVFGATAWSVKAAVGRRRRGEAIGRFLPILVAYLVARGIIGIVTDSEAVYFGIGIGTKAGIGVALIATAVAGRPFLGRVLHLALPVDRTVRAHEAWARVTSRLTVAWGLWLLATSGFDVWLFNQTSADGYVLIRALVGWPAGILLTLAGFWWADRCLRVVPDFPGLLHVLEEQDERRRKR